jgi:hypothetical protein
VSADSSVGLLSGPVTCLAVRGNVATMNVQTSSIFGQVTFQVTDNSAAGTADVIVATDIPPRPPSDCSPLDPNTAVPGRVLTGDVVVVDAPPLPASKEQCKNGGWARFGFRNQGQCVAFVQQTPQP